VNLTDKIGTHKGYGGCGALVHAYTATRATLCKATQPRPLNQSHVVAMTKSRLHTNHIWEISLVVTANWQNKYGKQWATTTSYTICTCWFAAKEQ